MSGQRIPALIAALVQGGVDPNAIYEAVGRVQDIKLGESIAGNDHLLRAFAFEQAKRLEDVR